MFYVKIFKSKLPKSLKYLCLSVFIRGSCFCVNGYEVFNLSCKLGTLIIHTAIYYKDIAPTELSSHRVMGWLLSLIHISEPTRPY